VLVQPDGVGEGVGVIVGVADVIVGVGVVLQ